MKKIRITRTVTLPDLVRISRYERVPELGPRVLFFSGGTALTATSRALKAYTHNSIHLVTAFDSGGSSAKLRDAFDMPSIGDLRSRLMALADESIRGHPDIFRLFTYRFPKDASNKSLRAQLDAMLDGDDPRVASIENPMQRLILNQLGFFREAMPKKFDLRGASIGNLILAGGYLNNHQQLDPIIFLFTKLVGVLGTVRTIANQDLHIGAELEDGSVVVGQHRLTGKEVPPLTIPIKRLFLSESRDEAVPAEAMLPKKKRKLIGGAELICYPPGSFYSSLLANLLPQGVGSAIADNDCPKVYVPSLGKDPEMIGKDLVDAVQTLIDTLRQDAGADCPVGRLVNFILIDSQNGAYASPPLVKKLHELGVQVIDTPLASEAGASAYDPRMLTAALLSLT